MISGGLFIHILSKNVTCQITQCLARDTILQCNRWDATIRPRDSLPPIINKQATSIHVAVKERIATAIDNMQRKAGYLPDTTSQGI